MKTRTISYKITGKQAGLTAEQFLRKEGLSNHIMISLKRTDRGILLNGIPVPVSYTHLAEVCAELLILQSSIFKYFHGFLVC